MKNLFSSGLSPAGQHENSHSAMPGSSSSSWYVVSHHRNFILHIEVEKKGSVFFVSDLKHSFQRLIFNL